MGDALIHASWIKYREVQRQRLADPKGLRRMVCQIIVGQAMDKRPEPIGLDSLNNGGQRLPVEVNLVLRYRMRSDCTVRHYSDEDDVN